MEIITSVAFTKSFEKTKAQKSDLHGTRPNWASSMGPANASDLHWSRLKPVTSAGASMREKPLREQAWASGLHGTRTKAVTSAQAGLRWGLPQEQAEESNFCQSRPKPALPGNRPDSAIYLPTARASNLYGTTQWK